MVSSLRVPALAGVALVAALLVSSFPARAADEGIDFATLKTPQPTETGDQIEVLEVFWYGCPHCWHLEPVMQAWTATMPAGVAFRRMPATGPRWEPHARAYYAAEVMGKLDVFHDALFKAMQVDKRPIFKDEDLVRFAGEIGLDEQEFRAAYDSFTVQAKVGKAVDMNRRYGIESVPAVIVNGKYRTSPGQTGTRDRFVEVLNTLVAQELAARPVAPPAAPAAEPAPALPSAAGS